MSKSTKEKAVVEVVAPKAKTKKDSTSRAKLALKLAFARTARINPKTNW